MMTPASAFNVQLSILHKAMYLSVKQLKCGNIGVLSALITLGIHQVQSANNVEAAWGSTLAP